MSYTDLSFSLSLFTPCTTCVYAISTSDCIIRPFTRVIQQPCSDRSLLLISGSALCLIVYMSCYVHVIYVSTPSLHLIILSDHLHTVSAARFCWASVVDLLPCCVSRCFYVLLCPRYLCLYAISTSDCIIRPPTRCISSQAVLGLWRVCLPSGLRLPDVVQVS